MFVLCIELKINMDVKQISINFCIVFTLFTYCLCYQCSSSGGASCQDRTISGIGTVRFTALISMHNSNSGNCGNVSPQGFQAAIALQWITELLNGNGSIDNAYIPGISLGKFFFTVLLSMICITLLYSSVNHNLKYESV